MRLILQNSNGPRSLSVVLILHVVFALIIVVPLEPMLVCPYLTARAKTTNPMDHYLRKLLTTFFASIEKAAKRVFRFIV